MTKLFIGLMVIFFLGAPSLQTLAWLGEMKTYMAAAVTSLASIVVSQFDGRSRHCGSLTLPALIPCGGLRVAIFLFWEGRVVAVLRPTD
jgi:ABC-type multidrug transport system permease subunit